MLSSVTARTRVIGGPSASGSVGEDAVAAGARWAPADGEGRDGGAGQGHLGAVADAHALFVMEEDLVLGRGAGAALVVLRPLRRTDPALGRDRHLLVRGAEAILAVAV